MCIGADYPQLQPKHIEQEMGHGPLHVYRSVFSCGFLLRGLEPEAKPVDEAAVAPVGGAAAVGVAAAGGVDPLPAAVPK